MARRLWIVNVWPYVEHWARLEWCHCLHGLHWRIMVLHRMEQLCRRLQASLSIRFVNELFHYGSCKPIMSSLNDIGIAWNSYAGGYRPLCQSGLWTNYSTMDHVSLHCLHWRIIVIYGIEQLCRRLKGFFVNQVCERIIPPQIIFPYIVFTEE